MTISEKVAYLKGLAEGLNLGEEIDVLSDDLADVESVVYDEDEDDEDYDDDWFEVECPTCGQTLVVDDEALSEGEVECPECGSRYALELSDDEEDEESGEDEKE